MCTPRPSCLSTRLIDTFKKYRWQEQSAHVVQGHQMVSYFVAFLSHSEILRVFVSLFFPSCQEIKLTTWVLSDPQDCRRKQVQEVLLQTGIQWKTNKKNLADPSGRITCSSVKVIGNRPKIKTLWCSSLTHKGVPILPQLSNCQHIHKSSRYPLQQQVIQGP